MIGGTYEYLMSSLPNLSFQNTEETKREVIGLLQKYAGIDSENISPEEILNSEAQKFLPATTFTLFKKFNLENIHELEFQQSKIKVLSAFSKFSYILKNDIKEMRLSQQGEEKKSIKSDIAKLLGDGTPLEKEIFIMKHQWEKIEELAVGHFADMEALFSYKIKLMILIRWWSFNAEKGFENFSQMTKNN